MRNMARKSDAMPKELLVYICDRDEAGKPVYGVALDVRDIPDDDEGTLVGNYVLNQTHRFRLTRSLSEAGRRPKG